MESPKRRAPLELLVVAEITPLAHQSFFIRTPCLGIFDRDARGFARHFIDVRADVNEGECFRFLLTEFQKAEDFVIFYQENRELVGGDRFGSELGEPSENSWSRFTASTVHRFD